MDQPRARGIVRLSAKYVEGRSRIDQLHQSGSLKVLFPRNQTSFLQAVTVNTAGGATGGDQFKIDALVRKNACLALTTQAAERIYMAEKSTTASIINSVRVEENAQLHWNSNDYLQKTLYFTVFLGFQGLPERSEIAPKSAREASWTSRGTKDRSGGPKLRYTRAKLSYIRRFWTPCRGTKRLRNPAQLTQRKSGQAKIPSNCSYMY